VIQNKIRRTKTSNIFQVPAVLVAGRQENATAIFSKYALKLPKRQKP